MAVVHLLLLALFYLEVPALRITVPLGLMAFVAVYESIAGLALGLAYAGGSIALILLLERWISGPGELDSFVLVMFAVVVMMFVFLLDSVTRDRRSAVMHRTLLSEALQAVATSPELGKTLDSIADSVRQAVHANCVAILLRDDDRLSLATARGLGDREKAYVDLSAERGARRWPLQMPAPPRSQWQRVARSS